MKLRILLFFCSTMFVSYIYAKTALQQLVVETNDKQKAYFALEEGPELSFNGATMIITTKSSCHSFEIADIAQYYFTDETTVIKELKANDLRISKSGNGQVTVEGLQSSSTVRLVSLDGKLLPAFVTYSDTGKATINLSSLPKGTYIISINKRQNLKINKR